MNRSKVAIYETLNNNQQTYAVTKEDLVKSHDLHMLFGIIGGFIIIFLLKIEAEVSRQRREMNASYIHKLRFPFFFFYHSLYFI